MDNTLKERFSLEEMAVNPDRAKEFADLLEEEGLLLAPANLKSAILERSRKADIRVIAGSNQLSKKAELIRYSLKISLAMACSIALLVAAPDFQNTVPPAQSSSQAPIHVEVCQKLEKLTGKIRLFSKSLLNPEVFFHD